MKKKNDSRINKTRDGNKLQWSEAYEPITTTTTPSTALNIAVKSAAVATAEKKINLPHLTQ